MTMCDMCRGSNHVTSGNRCICLDGSQDGAMRGLRKIIKDLKDEAERLRTIIQFARDKCVVRDAGTLNSPFAYLWQRDWDEFVRRSEAAKTKED